MTARQRPPRALVALGFLVGALFSGCAQPSDAEVLLSYDGFSDPRVGDLQGVRVELFMTHTGSGEPASAYVSAEASGAFRSVFVKSPIPMQCQRASCSLTLSIPPGTYDFSVRLAAEDRCGRPGELARFTPSIGNPVTLVSNLGAQLSFTDVSYAFDDDGDGIENVLEVAVCGRFDFDDRDQPARSCAASHADCCTTLAGPALVGRMGYFEGGAYDRRFGAGEVPPFYLDSTEVTWGQYARCVAAGACLLGQPEHPARAAVLNRDWALPVTGLDPREAAAYCAWAGKRLPRDEEWDFAAAANPDGTRRAYPWSVESAPHLLGLTDGDRQPRAPLDPIACTAGSRIPSANYDAPDQDCAGQPVAVGQFTSSYVWPQSGAPLADMAGNVYEWTLGDDTTERPPAFDTARVLPSGASRAHLRGGHFDSGALLLSNDFRSDLVPDDPGDISDPNSAFYKEVARLKAVAGFRCALDGNRTPGVREPLCPTFEDSGNPTEDAPSSPE